MAAVSNIVFILYIALSGGPLQQVGKYPSLDDCKTAVSMTEMMATKNTEQPGEWGPAKLIAVCVPAGLDAN
ncbi:hypothetical protein [Devosia sp.]|uniref:hypothetical protein n=1 Tax=Devosia sp. TaxID=1871048 RepID=UPI003267CEB9